MIIIGKLSLRRFEQTEQPVTVRSLAGQVFPCPRELQAVAERLAPVVHCHFEVSLVRYLVMQVHQTPVSAQTCR